MIRRMPKHGTADWRAYFPASRCTAPLPPREEGELPEPPPKKAKRKRTSPTREAFEAAVARGEVAYDGETIVRGPTAPSDDRGLYTAVTLDSGRHVVRFKDSGGAYRRVSSTSAAWWFATGDWPPLRWMVLPINGDYRDLSRDNLRLLTPSAAVALRGSRALP